MDDRWRNEREIPVTRDRIEPSKLGYRPLNWSFYRELLYEDF